MLEPKEAREQLEEILNSEEYQRYYQDSNSWLETWWEKAKEWIGSQLAKLFPAMESAGAAAAPILVAIIVIVLIVLAVTAFIIFQNVKRNRQLRKQTALQSMMESKWSYHQHLMEAKKREGAGEYTHASRHLFLALLLSFHEKKWLEAKIWKTNWEYYEELRRVDQSVANTFSVLAAFFDEVTYGERVVTEHEYLSFRNDAKLLLNETNTADAEGGEST